MGHKIAVFDASTLIGHEILAVLAESDLVIDDVYALTGMKQSGRELSFGDRDIKTQNVLDFDLNTCDLFIHTGHEQDAKDIMEKAKKAGVSLIDAGGHYLFDDIQNEKTVSLPSPIGAQLAAVLKPLQTEAAIKRVVVSTYEATSGEGKDGMDELFNQSRKFFVHDAMENNVFGKQIAFNVIPQTDLFMKDGVTQSEWRLAAEMKTLVDKKIKLSATCVQVPVFIGNGMSVNVEFEGDMDAKTARSIWRSDDSIIIIDTESEMEFVSPAEIAGEDAIFLSRIRNDSSVDSGISFWCAADNIRACVALKVLNAVQNMLA